MTQPFPGNAEAEPEPWFLWQDAVHSPAANMAIDEALLMRARQYGRPLLRFYRWDRNAVSIGYVQKFAAAPVSGYAVVRRPTGGGVVYHDHDFTYTVVVPDGHWLTGLNRTRSYDAINRAVLAGLDACQIGGALAVDEIPQTVDRSTMVCFRSPTRYDIMLGNTKVAGSAQRRRREGILHQGSLHFGETLPVARQKLRAALCRGFETVLKVIFEPFAPDPHLLELAEHLVAERYSRDDWNRRR